MFGAKLSWCQIVPCQIVLDQDSWCQIVRFRYLGAKLSGAKLSGAKLSYNPRSAMLGEHLSQKRQRVPTWNPKISAKNVTWVVKKSAKIFFRPFSLTGRLNLWAKYSEPKKQIKKTFFASRSYKRLKCSQILPL